MTGSNTPPSDDPADAALAADLRVLSDAEKTELIALERIHRTELIISYILRSGVLISLILVLLGLIVTFVHHSEYFTSHEAYLKLSNSGAHFPHSTRDVWRAIIDFKGAGIVTLGLLVLIATPVVRVAISIMTFIYMRDKLYTLITSVVLALLILSFVLGKVE